MRTSKLMIIGLASLFLLIASTSESFAGVKLYNGAWIAESFGNDKVGIGTEASAFFEALGIPQGTLCHPAAPLCHFDSTPVTTAGPGTAWHPLGPGCRALTGGELPRPAKGGTNKPGGASCPGAPPTSPPCSKEPPLYRNKAFFTAGSLPDPQSCIAESTVGATKQPVETASKATVYLGYGDALRGIAMKGSPVTGSGLITTTGAAPNRNFKFPAAVGDVEGLALKGMHRDTTGSFVGEGPYLYSYTYADLKNDAGEFGKGKGFFSTAAAASVAVFTNKAGPDIVATITVKDGTNRFGGVMRLLGSYTTKVCYLYAGGCGLGYGTWNYEAIGTAAIGKVAGVVNTNYVTSLTFTYFNTAAMTIAKYDQIASRWPWTTGTVTVNATARGAHKTFEQRKGFDNRTGSGVGTVQLVSPVLTQWLAQTANGPKLETGGIAILQIKFVPEPGVLTGLVAGLSLLAVLSRFRRS